MGDFGADNRAGVPGTLHRISAIRNRRGAIIGLTCRVGRAVSGHIAMLKDLVESECSAAGCGGDSPRLLVTVVSTAQNSPGNAACERPGSAFRGGRSFSIYRVA